MRTAIASILILVLFVGGMYASDSSKGATPLPIDSIPKLPESFGFTDYKNAAARETLYPDKVTWSDRVLRIDQKENALDDLLLSTKTIEDSTHYRSRDKQWEQLRILLARDNVSMLYYTLAGIYYDQQLSGWFKTYQWEVESHGTLRAHFHAESESGPFRIWLLELIMIPIPVDRITYTESERLSLIRPGTTDTLFWDIGTNHVTVPTPGK